jgi:ABC-2 type transport system ATP-binding protein
VIEAESLTRHYGHFVAVDDVSFRVPEGTILALLGPNGAGKTTIVRMLTGVMGLTSGRATVAGHDVGRDPAAVRARIGLVTDVPGLHEQMTAPAYLDFFGSVYGLPRAARARRVDELLAFFELAAHRKERMVGFSKGMKQKVALARALLHEPPALFLDEPTSGLDPLSARSVRDLIVGLKHASRSLVLCTHDLDEAERLADEIAIVRNGRIVRSGAPDRLRASGASDTSVQIELAEPCPRAAAALAVLAGELELSLPSNGASAIALTRLAYRTSRPVEVNPLVVARLVGVGAKIVAIECATPSLEDVYAAAVRGGPG